MIPNPRTARRASASSWCGITIRWRRAESLPLFAAAAGAECFGRSLRFVALGRAFEDEQPLAQGAEVDAVRTGGIDCHGCHFDPAGANRIYFGTLREGL